MGTSDRVVKAGEFKAKCLELMDQVAESGEVIVITKRGKAVAQLGPVAQERTSLFGCLKDYVEITGDIVAPIDVQWGPREPSVKRARTRKGGGR